MFVFFPRAVKGEVKILTHIQWSLPVSSLPASTFLMKAFRLPFLQGPSIGRMALGPDTLNKHYFIQKEKWIVTDLTVSSTLTHSTYGKCSSRAKQARVEGNISIKRVDAVEVSVGGALLSVSSVMVVITVHGDTDPHYSTDIKPSTVYCAHRCVCCYGEL